MSSPSGSATTAASLSGGGALDDEAVADAMLSAPPPSPVAPLAAGDGSPRRPVSAALRAVGSSVRLALGVGEEGAAAAGGGEAGVSLSKEITPASPRGLTPPSAAQLRAAACHHRTSASGAFVLARVLPWALPFLICVLALRRAGGRLMAASAGRGGPIASACEPPRRTVQQATPMQQWVSVSVGGDSSSETF